MADHKKRIDSITDRYNNSNSETRQRMDVSKDIDEVKREKRKIYEREDKKKYPKKYYLSAEAQALSSARKAEAFQLISTISPNIKNKVYDSEQFLLNEIKNAINLDERDYLSGLFDASDALLPSIFKPGEAVHKFRVELAELKKKYETNIELEDVASEIKVIDARIAEYEFIQQATTKQGNPDYQYIMFPRNYVQVFEGVDIAKDQKAKDTSFAVLPYVNTSMAFLSAKGVNPKL